MESVNKRVDERVEDAIWKLGCGAFCLRVGIEPFLKVHRRTVRVDLEPTPDKSLDETVRVWR